MVAFNRRLDLSREPADPIRTIGPVNRLEGLLSSPQAAPQAPRESLPDYMNQWGAYTPMDWQSIAPQLDQLGIDPTGQDGARGWQYNGGNPQHDGGGGDTPLWSLTPEAQSKLQGYTLGDREQLGKHNSQRSIYDLAGSMIGASQQDESRSMPWMETAVMAALGAMAAPVAGAALGGGVIGGAAGGAATGGLLADAFDKDVTSGVLMGGLGGGFNGYMNGGGGGGLDPFTPDSLKAWGQGAGVGVPDWESAIGGLGQDAAQSFPVAPQPMPSWVDHVPAEIEQSLQQASIQTPQQVNATMPELQPAQTWLDSVRTDTEASLQRSAQQTPAQVNATMPDVSAIPATVPTTGVSDFRAGEIKDYATDGRLPTSPAVPTGTGGLLGTLKGAGGTALDWMKANPALAKLMLGGASGLLAQQSGGTTSAPRQAVNPVQWQSPVKPMSQGLLGGAAGVVASGQSAYPAAMGLLGGQKNAGAWRFLGG